MKPRHVSPVRAFHSLVLGIGAGALLGFALHFLQPPVTPHLADHSELPEPPNSPEDTPPPTSDPALAFLSNPPGDSDADGMPDAWESQFGLNPHDDSDAASDLDRDGLTARQEYELHLRTGGQSGNPNGKWFHREIPNPPNYPSRPSMTLVEVTPGGMALYQVRGTRTGEPLLTRPYVFDSLTDKWTRVEPPVEHQDPAIVLGLDLNDHGRVVGYSLNSGTSSGFVWNPNDGEYGRSIPFTLSGGSPAVPQKISNTGYIVASEGNQPGPHGVASDLAGRRIVFPGQWTQVACHDVNDFGEFIGSFFNPVTGLADLFIAAEGHPPFMTPLVSNNPSWFSPAWKHMPALDLSTLGDIPNGIPHFVTDLRTGQNVEIVRDHDDAIFWKYEDLEYGGMYTDWYPLLESSPQSGIINTWGEFTGSSELWSVNYFDYGDVQTQGIGSLHHSTNYLFDGYFQEVGNDRGFHSLTGDARFLVSNPWAIGDRDVTIPLSKILPAGQSIYPVYPPRFSDVGGLFYNSRRHYQLIPNADADSDGIPDDWEINYGLDPNDPLDAFLVRSSDGISNHGKFLLRADPNQPLATDEDDNPIDTRPGIDTDGDGMPNVWEWENGLDYNDASDAHFDYDRDGFTNLQEFRLGTDPGGAPAFTIHEPGSFTDVNLATTATAANLGSAVLAAGTDGTDLLWFHATPGQGVARPATWSTSWGFSFRKSKDSQDREISHTQHVAAAPTGAALAMTTSTPRTLYFWPSADAPPIPLHGGHTAPAGQIAHNILSLSDVSFSPSGNYLVARRTRATSGTDWILWDMQAAPRVLSGVTATATATTTATITGTLRVNDFGHITGNGIVSGESRALFWKHTAGTGVLTPIVLPHLPGGSSSSSIGLSNHPAPIVAGTASTFVNGSLRNRATVWTLIIAENSPPTAIATDLGTLGSPLDSPPTAGTNSTLTAISPSGWVAGHADLLVNGTIRYQAITANPVHGPAATPVLGSLTPHGPPSAKITVTAINNSGEFLGTSRPETTSPTEIPTLWRRGKSHPLDQSLPPATGHTLISITAINENGSLLATAWKDNTRTTLVLSQTKDTDGDGLPDKWENENRFNPYSPHPLNADADGDQLTDLEEFRNGTDAHHPDTDRDGMHDGWEVSWGFLPLDPSDAHLDPDNDRVTNLREFQIGTTPTGIYKTEILATHPAYTYADLLAADDQGGIIHWGTEGFQEHEPAGAGVVDHYSYWQDVQYHPARGSSLPFTELPPYQESYQSGKNWSTNHGQWPSYWAGNGAVNGIITRYESTWDGMNSTWNQTHYLIPDALHPAALTPDSENNWFPWIPWETVESRLRNPDLHNGTPPLAPAESLNFYPSATSSDGTRRIHYIGNTRGRRLILDQEGQLIHILPTGRTWQFVNNAGTAIAAHYKSDPGGSILEIHQASAAGSPLPITVPISSGVANDYALKGFSDDGHVLLAQTLKNAQFATGTRHHLFNLHTRVLTPVRQPGFGNESLTSLSNQNARLLGKGPKPFQITPDGTCIKLEALRIQNHPESEPTPLHPGILNLHSDQTGTQFRHITSTGTITLFTSGPAQEQILQIIPHNDADGDGIPDDFLGSMRRYLGKLDLVASDTVGGIPVAQFFEDAENQQDSDGDGIYDRLEFEMGTDAGNPDSDGDGIDDGYDEDPQGTALALDGWVSVRRKLDYTYTEQQGGSGDNQGDYSSEGGSGGDLGGGEQGSGFEIGTLTHDADWDNLDAVAESVGDIPFADLKGILETNHPFPVVPPARNTKVLTTSSSSDGKCPPKTKNALLDHRRFFYVCQEPAKKQFTVSAIVTTKRIINGSVVENTSKGISLTIPEGAMHSSTSYDMNPSFTKELNCYPYGIAPGESGENPYGGYSGGGSATTVVVQPSEDNEVSETIIITLSPIDLVIDSDNNNDQQYPAGTSTEESLEEASGAADPHYPGKVVFANTGDIDFDGVPDFADGYSDLYETHGLDRNGISDGEAEKNIPQAAKLTPVLIRKVTTSKKIFYRLTYNQSSPQVISQTEDDQARRIYTAPPGLRLWQKDSETAEKHMPFIRKSVDFSSDGQGGHFLYNGIVLKGTDLNNFDSAPGGAAVIYMESTKYVEDIRAHSIRLEVGVEDGDSISWLASDTVNVTTVEQKFEALKEGAGDHNSFAATESHPSPIITVTSKELGEPSLDVNNGYGYSANLKITGTVTSEFLDTLSPRQGGEIKYIYLFVNGSEYPVKSYKLNNIKGRDPDNVLRPFPYVGHISIDDRIPCLPGTNSIELRTRDEVFRLEGANRMQFEYEVEYNSDDSIGDPIDPGNNGNELPPDQGSIGFVDVSQSYIQIELLDGINQGIINNISISSTNGEGQGSYATLTETAVATKAFTSDTLAYKVVLDEDFVPDDQLVQVLYAELRKPDGELLDALLLLETAIDSNVFLMRTDEKKIVYTTGGGQTVEEIVVKIDQPQEVYKTNGGEFHPFGIRLLGPKALIETQQGFSCEDMTHPYTDHKVDGGAAKFEAKAVFKEQKFYLANTDDPEVVGVLALRPAPDDRFKSISDQIYEIKSRVQFEKMCVEPGQFMEFARGFGAGFAKGGMDVVGGIGQVICAGAKFVYNTQVAIVRTGVSALRMLWRLGTGSTTIKQEAIAIMHKTDRVTEEVGKKWKFMKDIASDGPDAIIAVMKGEYSKLDHMSDNMKAVLQIGIEIIALMADELNSNDPFDKGQFWGRAVFEISSIIFPVGVGVKALSKVAMLAKIAEKSNFLRSGVAIIKAHEKVYDIWKDGCFTGDTLVHAEQGLVPIRDIAVGDYVYASPDDGSPKVSLKKVVRKYTTYCQDRVNVSLDHDNDSVADEVIETTSSHPIWCESIRSFVEAGKLRIGHQLRSLKVACATVLAVTTLTHAGEVTYDLEVDECHTYYVGGSQVLVHNNNLNAKMTPCQYFVAVMNRHLNTNQTGDAWDAFKAASEDMAKGRRNQFLNHQANKLGVNDLVPCMHVRVYSEYRKLVLNGKITGKKPWQPDPAYNWDFSSPGSAEVLRANMRKAGIPEELKGGAAHHIVPKGAFSSRSEPVRDALRDMQNWLDDPNPNKKIGINEPANGVILPKNLAEKYSFDTTYGDGVGPAHSTVHQDQYILKLHERLEDAKLHNRDLRDELQKIAVEMSEGAFP